MIIRVNNDAGSIELGPNITAQDIYWQSNQYGDLNLKIRGDSADSISAYGDLKIVNEIVTSSITNVKFSDGTVLDLSHGPSSFTWLGNIANFNIGGTTTAGPISMRSRPPTGRSTSLTPALSAASTS